MKNYLANETNVKKLGRTHELDGMLWCAFSGSGAEFVFEGKKAEVTVVGDSAAVIPENELNYARFAVFVDDRRVVDHVLTTDKVTCTVIDSDVPVKAVVRIVKLSETAMSTILIDKITVDDEAKITPTPQKDYYIEVIGDSITCGFGVDDEDPEHPFLTSTEDTTRAYAYRTAQMLGVDYSLVSISGYGIISGYSDDGETKREDQLIPNHYEQLGFSFANYNGKSPQDIPWDFTKREPDLIVINLGTNDDSYCTNHQDRQEDYTEHYVMFLERIRELNPNAKILCTLGIMGDNLYPCVEEAVRRYCHKTEDTRVGTMPFAVQLEEDGVVSCWHPTAVTHKKAAARLTNRIIEELATDGKNIIYGSPLPAEPIPHTIDSAKPVIALTFDDGPNTNTTPRVQELLVKYGVVASFFVIGENINDVTAPVLRKSFDLGCEIQNHSLTHPAMPELIPEEIRAEVDETTEKIRKIVGVIPNFFRPPYIAVDDKMFEAVGLPFIEGIGAEDWEDSVSASERVERILNQIEDGTIILLHDMNNNDNTVEALDTLIPELLNRGYQFATVSELFRAKKVVPEYKNKYVYTNVMQTTPRKNS